MKCMRDGKCQNRMHDFYYVGTLRTPPPTLSLNWRVLWIKFGAYKRIFML